MIKRRSVLKHGVGLAVAGATMTSILDRAYGSEGRGEMELSGGGRLVFERTGRGWQAAVVTPEGRAIRSPTGVVHTVETGAIGLNNGRVMDGVISDGTFYSHSQHSEHSETTTDGRQVDLADMPEWRQRPVLDSQANMLRQRGILSTDPDLRRHQDWSRLR